MGTIVAVEYLTLDGVMEGPAWSAPYFNEELQRFQYHPHLPARPVTAPRLALPVYRDGWRRPA